MKIYTGLSIMALSMVMLAGCSESTPEQNEKFIENALSGKFKNDIENMESVENLTDYKNVEAIDVVDSDDNELDWTLRKGLQPGKMWKGYTDLGQVQMPIGIKFSAEGHITWYAQDASGNWIVSNDDPNFKIDKITYSDAKDNRDLRGEGEEKDGGYSDEQMDKSIERVISFEEALDKNIFMPGDVLHWLPCQVGCEMRRGLDSLMIKVGPLTHKFK